MLQNEERDLNSKEVEDLEGFDEFTEFYRLDKNNDEIEELDFNE